MVIQSLEREKSKEKLGSAVGWMGHQLGNFEEVHVHLLDIRDTNFRDVSKFIRNNE